MTQKRKYKDSTVMRALKGNLWSRQTNIFVSIGLGLIVLGIGYIITQGYAAQPGSTLTGPIISAFPNKCLDNDSSTLQNGNKIKLWDCNNSDAQQWSA